MRARFTEIMESIQGEGLMIGSRNVFLRFSGCNLRCSYCDTPLSIVDNDFCRINLECGGGQGEWSTIFNPLSIDQVQEIIAGYNSRWISLTGGEPLLWAAFIAGLAQRLRPSGYRFLLETNGTLDQELETCLDYIDIVSMDYKLPSATGEDLRESHQEFLRLATRRQAYVKIVIEAHSEITEIHEAVGIIAGVSAGIPLILQPVTPSGSNKAPELPWLMEIQKHCLKFLEDVRILPQLHPYLKVI